MKKPITIAAAVIAALGATLLGAAPASASTASSSTVVTVPMSVDCSRMTADQIAKTRATGWDICEKTGGIVSSRGGVTTQGSVTANCGTASIYVDRMSKGKGRISWSLFSSKGNILHRDLSINWGPAGGGSFIDTNFMNSLDYSNNKHVLGSGKFSANMHGFVVVGSTTVTCTIPSVYANTVNI